MRSYVLTSQFTIAITISYMMQARLVIRTNQQALGLFHQLDKRTEGHKVALWSRRRQMASCLFSLQKPTNIRLDCLHSVFSYPLSHDCPPESYAPSEITTINCRLRQKRGQFHVPLIMEHRYRNVVGGKTHQIHLIRFSSA